jgi:hypothetical protein
MKLLRRVNILCLTLIAGLGVSLLTAGCGRTISKTEDTHVSSDGTVKSKDKTVTENPDGTITKTETKKTEKP